MLQLGVLTNEKKTGVYIAKAQKEIHRSENCVTLNVKVPI